MYTAYFGFREPPFLLPPNPRFLYASPHIQDVYASLRQGLQERKKLIVLTGEVGTGKTTLLHKLMEDLAETTAIAFVYHTTLTFDEILAAACEEFNLPTPEGNTEQKIQVLTDFALAQSNLGKNVVLLLDEAQDLHESDLEHLPLLLAPSRQGASPLQLLLAGQPELAVKLQSPRLRRLQQMIDLSCRLDCLPEQEVGPFIHHRLRAAGGERQDLFSPQAIQRVAFHSSGIPRVINVLCDNALRIAQTYTQQTISAGIVDLAAEHIRLRTEAQSVDLVEPDPTLTEDSESELTSVHNSTWLTAKMPVWSAVTLGVILIGLVGIVLYQAFPPGAPPELARHTPVLHAPETGDEELAKAEPFIERSAQLPEEAPIPAVETFAALAVDAPTPQAEISPPSPDPQKAALPAPQETVSPTASMTVEKSVAPQEPMASRPAASSSPQPLQTEQKTQPTALRDTRKKPPVTVAVFTLQTLAATPPQQLAPRSRPLSDDEQTLFQAVIAGDNQKVAHLLDAGVSPNVKSSGGWTPLMWAVIDGRLALIQTLLDKDAAVNVKNNRGMTPLMYAAWNGSTDILQLFLDKGANVHARDIHGATALHYARDPIAKFTRREERPRLERILAQAAAQKPRTKR